MSRLVKLLSVFTALFCTSFSIWADGFGIDATRVIYPASAGSTSITVRNTNETGPYLVKVAVSNSQDVINAAPFNVTPPLFRLEPKSINQLRIAFYGAPLPLDRESVFYLHASAIPAGKVNNMFDENKIKAQLSFGVGNIIKVFYRPDGLAGTSGSAQKGLNFVRVSDELTVKNPSPYYVSLASLTINGKKQALDSPSSRMIAPFGSNKWKIDAMKSTRDIVEWRTINDVGGVDAFKMVLP